MGLSDNSRVKRAISNQEHVSDNTLMANILDLILAYFWLQGKKRTTVPKPILTKIEKPVNDIYAVSDANEFEKIRNELINS